MERLFRILYLHGNIATFYINQEPKKLKLFQQKQITLFTQINTALE